MGKKGNWWKATSVILASVGAINWGLVALLNTNIVTAIFASAPTLVTVTYIAVGIGGVVTALKQFGAIK